MSQRFVLVLAAGSVVIALSMGARQVFGLFLTPVVMDLQLSREVFGLVVGVQNLVWGFAQPVAGWFADRFGARRVILAGGLLYVAGLALGAASDGAGEWALTIGVLVGLAQSGTAFAVVLGAIGHVAPPEKRGLALGLGSAAGSIGMFVMVPVAHWMISGWDWRGALLSLAALAVLMPLLAVAIDDRPSTASQGKEQSWKAALLESAGDRSFWLLNAGFAACGFQLAFLSTHLPSVILDASLPTIVGAAALATIGAANIVGTYFCGVLGDVYRKKRLLAYLYLARAVLLALFFLTPISTVSVILFAAGMGLLWTGTVPLTSALVADLYGHRYMSMLFGVVYLGHQLGAFAGAWIGGLVFDLTGSYNAIWIGTIGAGVAAAALHWPIRDPDIPLRSATAAT